MSSSSSLSFRIANLRCRGEMLRFLTARQRHAPSSGSQNRLTVPAGVAGEFQQLGEEVLEDSGWEVRDDKEKGCVR